MEVLPKRILCVYDIQEKEICIAQFDSLKELAKYFNRTKDSITCAVSRNTKIENRYEVKWVNL